MSKTFFQGGRINFQGWIRPPCEPLVTGLTRPSEVRDVVTPLGPRTASGPLSRGQQELQYCQSFLGHLDTWPNELVGIFRFVEVALHSGFYRFHSCALGREVPRRELNTKIPSLPLVFRILFFQSLPKIHDHM